MAPWPDSPGTCPTLRIEASYAQPARLCLASESKHWKKALGSWHHWLLRDRTIVSTATPNQGITPKPQRRGHVMLLEPGNRLQASTADCQRGSKKANFIRPEPTVPLARYILPPAPRRWLAKEHRQPGSPEKCSKGIRTETFREDM